MYIEHLFCNCALAVLAGMVLTRERTGDDIPYALIIIGCTWIPDIPTILSIAAYWSGMPVSVQHIIPGPPFLHNLAGLAGFCILAGLLLRPSGFRFGYTVLCSAIGYGSHLIADSLTHMGEYSLLWPLTSQPAGIGIFFPYTPDFFGLAETKILVATLLFLILATGFRTLVQGTGWIHELVPGIKKTGSR